MDYVKLLENSYEREKEFQSNGTMERLEFLAENIFDFTTYESVVYSLIEQKCLEVCKAISEKKTFEYIKSDEGNLWYLIMVNMPFFEGKLEWGTSIRGAWWHLYGDRKFTVESCGLYVEYEQLLEISFDEDEWPRFIDAMIEFARSE
jgi:hypothetical protein